MEAAKGEAPLPWAPAHAIADLPRKIEAHGDQVVETLLTTRMGPYLPEARTELLIDPGTSFWRRLAVCLVSVLPIEGQL